MQMENIVLELQLELFVTKNKNRLKIDGFFCRKAARDEAEFKRKKSQQSGPTTPPKSLFNFAARKMNSPTTPTNDHDDDDNNDDIDT